MHIELVAADDGDRLLEVARMLMAEYAAMPHITGRWLTIDADLAALPAPFVPPLGALLVAVEDGQPLACGALSPLEPPAIAELKRVYVRPSARGRGVGEAMTRALMDRARGAGYSRVRLDTAPELTAALALYRRLGFHEIAPYHEVGAVEFVFLERVLDLPEVPDVTRSPSP